MATTSKTRWTPGPWTVDGFHGRAEKVRSADDKELCVAIMPNWHEDFAAERAANARLISKAPKMAELLMAIAQEFEDHDLGGEPWMSVKALLRSLEAE